MIHLDRELQTAIDLARQAGEVILDHYRAGVTVEYKVGDEPVTAADHAADLLIRTALRRAFPGDGILTEESEDDRSRLHRERVWIVDPLDGTGDFVDQTDDFVVQIGLAIGGEPWLGVVYQPVTGHLFYAAHGQGAFEQRDGRTHPVHVSSVADPARMCLVASRSHYTPFIDRARQALDVSSTRRAGSVGIKVGLVARGDCDLYLGTTVCKEWDVCAPHAVLLEAGGLLTGLRGEAITYNKPEIGACPGLVGSNGCAHARVLDALAPILERAGR
ncbi:MAG TPA: 3'(2'),5'-bisphosphate nucleotidase CysQ [Anaerolineae bacterium]|nr:3'(2'),5'-bisphosphate nucleotidase CysQ [Anaerolineae bacterium]